MINKTLIVFLFVLISSCASMSNNRVLKGTASFSGGVYQSQYWDDLITFERVSWFQELSLLFDVLVTEIDSESSFNVWFSPSEMQLRNSCRDFKVVMTYALDSSRLSESEFFSQANKAGYQKHSLPQFSSYLKMHPQFNRQSLNLYHVSALCLPKGQVLGDEAPLEEIKINFANYEEVVIK